MKSLFFSIVILFSYFDVYLYAYQQQHLKFFSFTNTHFVKSNGLHVMQMAQKSILMPALSSTMKEGKVISWNKKVGEKVNVGDILLVVESVKADMDVEAFESGYLGKILTKDGSTAAVGAVVAVIVDSKEEIASLGSSEISSETNVTPKTIDTVEAQKLPQPTVTNTNIAIYTPAISQQSLPNFESVKMPALSSTMKEGKVISWNKKIGDKVSPGDVLLVVESDKADMDVESYEEGYLAAICVPASQSVAVGSPLAYIVKKKEEIEIIQKTLQSGTPLTATAASVSDKVSEDHTPNSVASIPIIEVTRKENEDRRVAASGYAKKLAKERDIDLKDIISSRPDGYITSSDLENVQSKRSNQVWKSPVGEIQASPSARKLAEENNLDLTQIKGTGPFGRITPEDVLKAAGKFVESSITMSAEKKSTAQVSHIASPTSTATAVNRIAGLTPMTAMQKAVSKNMEKSLSIPVFRVTR